MGIGFLITIHEFGHYLFCRLFKIPTPTFAIGIGPTIFKKKFPSTLLTIGLFPVAGYVQIGLPSEKESDTTILKQRPLWKSGLILFGGIGFNILFAYIAIISVTLLTNNNKIIEKFQPHPILVVKQQDILKQEFNNATIVECNGEKISCIAQIVNIIQQTKQDESSPVKLTVEKNNEISTISVDQKTLLAGNYIGLATKQTHSFFGKIMQGATTTTLIIITTLQSIISTLTKKNIHKFSGFVGIINSSHNAIKISFDMFIAFLAIISISLAILNCLPVPIFDGGQFALLVIKKIFKKYSFETIETVMTYASFALIALLTLYTTYNDIIHWFIK